LKRLSASITMLVCLLVLTGCSFRSNLTMWAMRPVLDGAITSLLAETDIELARAGLESNLKLLEGIIRTKPDDRELLTLAARGFTGYAMMFLEDSEPDRARLFYERARTYGMRVLEMSARELSEADITLAIFQGKINDLKRKDLPAAYWTATAWAQRINLELTSTESIAEFPRATALMQWVLDNDPTFYYSGPLWFFGTYYSSLPPLLGGDPERSKDFFSQAVEADGSHFLWGKLLYARYYAVQTLDRELFVELLEEVKNGAKDEPEDLRLINRIAALKAEKMLQKVDQFF